MRPGRLNPGKHYSSLESGTTMLRFNEAGAIKPRKGRMTGKEGRVPLVLQ